MSIKKFLFIGLFSVLTLSFSIIFFLNRSQTSYEVSEVYGAQLAQTSRILQGFLNRPKDKIDFSHLTEALATSEKNYNNDTPNDEGHPYELKFAIQIWDKDQNLLTKSPGISNKPISAFKNGYSVATIGKDSWNVFAHQMEDYGYWVLIAERGDVRDEMIDDIIISSLVGPVVGMLILVFSVFIIVNQGLKPLISLSQQIYSRHIDKLEPLDLSKSPKELIPIANAVNTLMYQIEKQIERERQFLGDIAHELRTPLASIKLQAQSALKNEDSQASNLALVKIIRSVDSNTHLISQLLTLARLDLKALGDPEIIDIQQSVDDALKDLKKWAHHVSIHYNHVPSTISGYPVLITALIRNLLENAMKHTPLEKGIYLNTEARKDEIIITIKDEGSGVSEQKIQSLGQRFFREKAADQSGNGLGLSIVSRIIELHKANIIFEHNEPNGLIVKIIMKTTKK